MDTFPRPARLPLRRGSAALITTRGRGYEPRRSRPFEHRWFGRFAPEEEGRERFLRAHSNDAASSSQTRSKIRRSSSHLASGLRRRSLPARPRDQRSSASSSIACCATRPVPAGPDRPADRRGSSAAGRREWRRPSHRWSPRRAQGAAERASPSRIQRLTASSSPPSLHGCDRSRAATYPSIETPV